VRVPRSNDSADPAFGLKLLMRGILSSVSDEKTGLGATERGLALSFRIFVDSVDPGFRLQLGIGLKSGTFSQGQNLSRHACPGQDVRAVCSPNGPLRAGRGRVMRKRFVLTSLAAGLALPASMAMAIPSVIYSDIATSPTSDVPGIAGAKFTSFDRPYRSPNSLHWIFTADTDIATLTQDEVIILGSGLSGTVAVQEGVTQVAPPATELAGLLDRNLWVTNSGDFAYGTNTDGPTTTDEIIARRLGGVSTAPIREGDPAPGIPGATLGISNHSAYIAGDGRVGFVGTSLIGTGGTTTDSAVFFDNGVIAQEGITVPAGQAGGATNTWQVFDFESAYFANSGATHLIQGDTNAASGDDILAFNGSVVLQETQVVPGSGFVSPIATEGITEALLTANGDWFARGGNVDLQDWVVRNGTLLARTDEAVPGGLPGEQFDDATFAATFFTMTGNSVGDHVYGGVTNNVDLNANAVLIFNDSLVFLREGDPVDVNGNGLPDDDAFISVFNNDDAFLTDSLLYYFTADLRNAAGTTIGQAFLAVQIPEPATLSVIGLSALALLRRRRF
jgi:hypothetical protein